MKIRAIVNEDGGALKGRAGEALVRRLEKAFAEAGINADVRITSSSRIHAAFVEAAAAPGLDAVVAGGGDGTISCAAGALAGGERPLGIVPLGTLNHLARDAGIPTDLDEAVALIASGKSRRIDVAEVNGRVFVNNSAVGLYPDFVRDREAQQHQSGRSKRLAMIWASLRALDRFPRKRLTIEVAGHDIPIETPLLFVGNNRYDMSLTTLGTRDALDRGELCLYAALVRTRWQFVKLALRGLAGRLRQERDFLMLDGIAEAVIRSPRASLEVSTDGEAERLGSPLRYRIRPGALRLIAPER